MVLPQLQSWCCSELFTARLDNSPPHFLVPCRCILWQCTYSSHKRCNLPCHNYWEILWEKIKSVLIEHLSGEKWFASLYLELSFLLL